MFRKRIEVEGPVLSVSVCDCTSPADAAKAELGIIEAPSGHSNAETT